MWGLVYVLICTFLAAGCYAQDSRRRLVDYTPTYHYFGAGSSNTLGYPTSIQNVGYADVCSYNSLCITCVEETGQCDCRHDLVGDFNCDSIELVNGALRRCNGTRGEPCAITTQIQMDIMQEQLRKVSYTNTPQIGCWQSSGDAPSGGTGRFRKWDLVVTAPPEGLFELINDNSAIRVLQDGIYHISGNVYGERAQVLTVQCEVLVNGERKAVTAAESVPANRARTLPFNVVVQLAVGDEIEILSIFPAVPGGIQFLHTLVIEKK